jgi:predicted O-methyltransferase YrrM
MINQVDTIFSHEERYPIDRELIDPLALPVGDYYGDDIFNGYFADYAGMARKYKPKRILEIGVRYGYTGLVFVHAIKKLRGSPNVEYVGLDDESYHGGSNVRANANFQTVFPNVPMQARTWNTITMGLPPDIGTFDLIHVDGNHERRWAVSDLSLVWPILNEGGIVMMDDCSMTADDPRFDIYEGVMEWLTERRIAPELIEWQYHTNERNHLYLKKCG